LIVQIIKLSDSNIYKRYSDLYKITLDHSCNIFGLEIRNINSELLNKLLNVFSNDDKFKDITRFNKNKFSLFSAGSLRDIKEFSQKFAINFSLNQGEKVFAAIKGYEGYDNKVYKIGEETFIFDKPYVMGILNVTDDSFSDGGKYLKTSEAANHAIGMLEDGADFIDIGGESTRPGSDGITAEMEIQRVIPVIEKVIKERPDAIISVDTTKSVVAEEALKSGAKVVNDISAFNFDPKIIEVAQKYDAGYVLMHMKGRPKEMQINPHYDDVISEVYGFLFEKTSILENAGLTKIFIDPGIGFGKRIEDNFEILKRLEDFKSLGYPVLVGVSRKSFIGKTLNLEVNNRDNATSIVDSIAIKNGAKVIRTHNVKNGVQVCKLLKQLA
jgi:dihydropteroate synthase